MIKIIFTILLLTNQVHSQFTLPNGFSSVRFPISSNTNIDTFFGTELSKVKDLWLLDTNNKSWKYYSPNTESQHKTIYTSFNQIIPNSSYIINLISAIDIDTPFVFNSLNNIPISTGIQFISLQDSIINLDSITNSTLSTRLHSIFSLWNNKWYSHFYQASNAMTKIQSLISSSPLTILSKSAAFFINFAPNMNKISIDKLISFSSDKINHKILIGDSINTNGIPIGSVSHLGLETSTSNGKWYGDIYYPKDTKNLYFDFINNHQTTNKSHLYTSIDLNQTKHKQINLSPAHSLITLYQSQNKDLTTSEVLSSLLTPLILNDNINLNQSHAKVLMNDPNSNFYQGLAVTQNETTVVSLSLQVLNEILSNSFSTTQESLYKKIESSFHNILNTNPDLKTFSNSLFSNLASLNTNTSLQSKFNQLNTINSQSLNLSFSQEEIKSDNSWNINHLFYVGAVASKISKIENETAYLIPIDSSQNYQFSQYPDAIKISISPYQDEFNKNTKLEVLLQSTSSEGHFLLVTAETLSIEKKDNGQFFTGILQGVSFSAEAKTPHLTDTLGFTASSTNSSFDSNDFIIGKSSFIEVPIKQYIDKAQSISFAESAIKSFEGQNNTLTITLSDLFFTLNNKKALKFNKIKVENLRVN
ncbi:MAG: hypothetical protein COB02_14140 [Candidatus Cloacimonadota bacterium]|nr:MAG: hypothetical protein COB02_14140 [Candidatus Cloacimonadota bacterium]